MPCNVITLMTPVPDSSVDITLPIPVLLPYGDSLKNHIFIWARYCNLFRRFWLILPVVSNMSNTNLTFTFKYFGLSSFREVGAWSCMAGNNCPNTQFLRETEHFWNQAGHYSKISSSFIIQQVINTADTSWINRIKQILLHFSCNSRFTSAQKCFIKHSFIQRWMVRLKF